VRFEDIVNMLDWLNFDIKPKKKYHSIVDKIFQRHKVSF
jgi:hypothetical protein